MRPKMSARDAQAWAEALRYEALRQKRAAGEPRAPMRARPGQEAAFWKAEADLAALDLILKLLEREARLERLLAGGRRIARARRFAADYLATLLASMAAVGLGFLAAAGFWIAAAGPPAGPAGRGSAGRDRMEEPEVNPRTTTQEGGQR